MHSSQQTHNSHAPILRRQYHRRRSTSDIRHTDLILSKERSAEAWQILSDTLYYSNLDLQTFNQNKFVVRNSTKCSVMHSLSW